LSVLCFKLLINVFVLEKENEKEEEEEEEKFNKGS
jgi:hypothetical protein